jgi:cytochrome P450
VRFTYLHSSEPRTRGGLPPAPSLPAVLQTLACRLRPLEYLEWCRARIGARFTVNAIDMPPLVFLSDPADIRAIVTAPLAVLPPGAGAVTAPLLGETSFILREEDEHLNGRAAIMPAFHRRIVGEHTKMVNELAHREVASWPVDTPISIHPRLCALTLTVMLKAVFGDNDPAIDTLHDRLISMLSVTASLVLQEPRLHHLPGWHATWQRFTSRREEVDELIADLIGRRRHTQGRHGDMLDMLLDASRADGTPMTETEVRDNLVSVIIAGHETTASALAWAFQLIAHHPGVQDRLIREIDAGSSEQYLTAAVNEVLRHRPVFLFTAPRMVVQPIEIGDWTLHPPAHLLACIYLMHHDPALFPDPHEFRPERFLDSRDAIRTWLPWGGGRQRCPGRHLALLELRTVLRATLSTRRVLAAASTIERARWRSAIVTPHAGSIVVLRKRRRDHNRHYSSPAASNGHDQGHGQGVAPFSA